MEGENTYINVPKCASYNFLTFGVAAKISGSEPYGKNKIQKSKMATKSKMAAENKMAAIATT